MSPLKYFIAFFVLIPSSLWAVTILLDPGHGGDDKGAKGFYYASSQRKYVLEKNLSLRIAKKIKEFIPKEHSVYLTRGMDRNISLQGRAEIAEKVKADLFISIHVNSSAQKDAQGFETYYLDNHQDAAVRKLEEVENKNLMGEDPIVEQILMDLIIQKTVETSRTLSTIIHQNLKTALKKFNMKNRGIKPGLFYVLALAKRPAILLEVGFMSHPRELQKMDSSSFQASYARAVARGITSYLEKY